MHRDTWRQVCHICLLCEDGKFRSALLDAVAADGGFQVVTDADDACHALLLDGASLIHAPLGYLEALRRNGVRVFLLLDGYNAAAAASIRNAVDHLFYLPMLPSAILRRVRLFLGWPEECPPPPTFDSAWIGLQTDVCLKAVGMAQHLLGYRYMRTAVEFLIRNEAPMHLSMMRDIYPTVAKTEGTSAVMVDRAIKHAVEVAWRKGNVLMQQIYFGYSSVDMKGMPTNAEWLYAVADRVRLLLCDTRGKKRFTDTLLTLHNTLDCGLSVDVTDAAW